MWPPVQYRQRTEILVQCHQDPLLSVRVGKDLLVAWILSPIACPDDIVSGINERLPQFARHA